MRWLCFCKGIFSCVPVSTPKDVHWVSLTYAVECASTHTHKYEVEERLIWKRKGGKEGETEGEEGKEGKRKKRRKGTRKGKGE